MSLDKAITHKKEKRKPYTGGKAVDTSCRNHGSCDWCQKNRQYHNLKEQNSMEQQWQEYLRESEDEDKIQENG